MCPAMLRDFGFYDFLFSIGQDLAEQARSGGCPGRLHQATTRVSPEADPRTGGQAQPRRLSAQRQLHLPMDDNYTSPSLRGAIR